MRLATIPTETGTRAVRIDGDDLVALPYPDVASLLSDANWRTSGMAGGVVVPGGASLLGRVPVVRPNKTVCVGLNYRGHIEEVGETTPRYPTLFAKFSDSLTGANSAIGIPSVSTSVDWEAELGIVIGAPAHRVEPSDAMAYVAGMTVVNDVSMRDWQSRTSEWFAGKNFEATTPVGPALVTLDELDDPLDLGITCEVDGVVMQQARTSDLLFGIADLISYISTFTTLQPGDLIATGTPSGVAAGRIDKPFLRAGQVATVTIEGVGSCRNEFYAEAVPAQTHVS